MGHRVQQPGHGLGGHGLAAARLAQQGQGASGPCGEADLGDHAHHALGGADVHVQARYFQHCLRGGVLLNR
ncbi:hypothetical protein D3C74_459950 [compost metagenome]